MIALLIEAPGHKSGEVARGFKGRISHLLKNEKKEKKNGEMGHRNVFFLGA
jgi:hypothetical protein